MRLWNWAEQRLIDGINLRSAPVHFSADENTLLCRTQNGFEVLSLQTKEVIVSIRTGTQLPHFLAWHPAGKFVLSRPRQDQIGIIDLDAGQLFKTLYSGTVVDWSTLAGAFSGKLKQAGISDDQLPDMHEGFIRGTDEPFSLKFSPDGRLLFCGTTRGLRVLEWEKVLAAERSTPAPLFSASPLPLQSPLKPIEKNDYTNFIYDVALDENQDRVLFCGTEGTIRFFNLSDKSTGILLKPPTINSIWRLQISPDRKFISCLCTPPVEDRNTKPARIQIWNYQLLRAATGLN